MCAQPAWHWAWAGITLRPPVKSTAPPLLLRVGFLPSSSKQLYMEAASLFLLRDGTVITIFQSEGHSVMQPILELIKKCVPSSPRSPSLDMQDCAFILPTQSALLRISVPCLS